MNALFHIISRSTWRVAISRGEYRAESLDREGFVHCSFAHQVARVANARYRDLEDLCVVEFDAARVAVIVEDSYGSGTAYPHVYGPIPTDAAVAVHALTRDARGAYTFSAFGAAGAASQGR